MSLTTHFFGPSGVAARQGIGAAAPRFDAIVAKLQARNRRRQQIVDALNEQGYYADHVSGQVIDLQAVRAGQRLDAAPLPSGAKLPVFDAPEGETQREALHRAARTLQLREDALRVDAMSPMASQALTWFYERVYEIQHRDLVAWDEQILRIDRRPDPAAREIVWYELDMIGAAKAGSTYSPADIPLVGSPIMEPNGMRVVPGLVGYETNFMTRRQEALSAANGKPTVDLERIQVDACNRTLAQYANALWLFGDAQLQIGGWLNDPRVATTFLPGAPWAGKTGLQIANDLSDIFWTIRNASVGRLRDIGNLTLYLPPAQFQRANQQPVTGAADKSALAYTMENLAAAGSRPRAIKPLDELQAAQSFAYDGGPQELDSDTAVLVYEEGDMDKDPTFTMPQDVEVVPAGAIQTGVGEVIYFHERVSGMRLPDAERMHYFKGL